MRKPPTQPAIAPNSTINRIKSHRKLILQSDFIQNVPTSIGDPAMTDWKIPLYKIYWDEDDVDAVSNVIRRGMFWTGGESVGNFEEEVAKVAGSKHGIAFNSGTSAQLAILNSLGISTGDEVIVPSFTFISTCNTVVHTGAKPVFAEIEGETFGLDAQDVERKITSKTKAIIPVHYAGTSCKIDEIMKVADENNIYVIEDAAEALGSVYNGKPVGSSGIAAMYSFCGNKVITTGEGGMLVTNNDEIMESLHLVRSHGRTDKGSYFSSSESFDYISLGHNWRISEITAELGRSQLRKLSMVVNMRRDVAKMYAEVLDGLPLIYPNPSKAPGHIYQMYTVLFENNSARENVRNTLSSEGIMSKIYFNCVHLTTSYKEMFDTGEGLLPVTEDLAERVLTLPMFPTMTADEVQLVGKIIKNIVS
jgi:perosamine synthetase